MEVAHDFMSQAQSRWNVKNLPTFREVNRSRFLLERPAAVQNHGAFTDSTRADVVDDGAKAVHFPEEKVEGPNGVEVAVRRNVVIDKAEPPGYTIAVLVRVR